MKNRQIGLVVCGILLALLLPTTTIASALRAQTEPDSCDLFGRTLIRGFVVYLGRDSSGRMMRYFALRLHYFSISLTGERDRGVIHMRNIEVPTRMTGYRGNVYISASFRGSLNI